ncbi:thioesterase II family protein [Streptomyces somaliensis]|uniref:Thioesterase n=1 Tax=Streptomyces somaliensis (strain ATCC 33201 / DSM 40738 / JCM 12659 / KCTC 9044 / NCTC 11332 / NRRL B-12077 / IP 733) TaxID=1134445 RepID=A0AA44DEN8_STRE0|nr:alpha/beta fold hydrolase [Streptomyces somaliensis]NKY14741.1 thioesterase [Streptomyces somaliensis DSM 40738]
MTGNPPGFRPQAEAGYCPRPVPGAALRLFLFHHAGGSHLLYRDWVAHFPADWEIHLPDAPGRGRLADLPACADAERLVDFFLDGIVPVTDRPFAFFGHSMGGLVAYELTNRLAAEGLPLPVWLGLSARGAPRQPGPADTRHRLPDADLRRHLVRMGGTPPEVLDDPDVWQLFEPMIRNDLRLVETWSPRPRTPPLTVPLSVFGGTDDVVVPPERLAAWERHAERFLGLHLLDGDHFYLRGRSAEMARLITGRVRSATAAAR